MPVRAFVLYEREPEADRYRRHVDEYALKVPGASFSHGRVFGAAVGEQQFAYYAEFEWPDMESFKQGTRSSEFAESGRDAMEMRIPFTVHFAEIE
jgi:hypothetical protein